MPKFQGVIFDVDGVLVNSPHEKAWRESLRELMESSWSDIRDQTTWSPDGFTAHMYQQYVAGKPRASGARAALDYFHVPDTDQRVAEYAQRKQEMVVRLIQAGDFTAYPDALRFVIATKDAGMLIADASSSKNAALFLRQIRLDTFAQEQGISSPTLRPGQTLLDYFDVDVSGRDFAHGKPDPEIFLTAAHELGVEPRHAFVIEDASAGVQAAKAGGMAAIGIARADDADLLAAADADLVVTTLDDVDTTALSEGRLARRQALGRGAAANCPVPAARLRSGQGDRCWSDGVGQAAVAPHTCLGVVTGCCGQHLRCSWRPDRRASHASGLDLAGGVMGAHVQAGLTDRRSECGTLDRLIEAVRTGESRALVVRGEPGVGKTVLLSYLAGQARGCQVQIARPATARAHRQLPGQGRLRRLREPGGLLVPYVLPGDRAVPAQRVGEPVQRIPRDPVHPLYARRLQRRHHHIRHRGRHQVFLSCPSNAQLSGIVVTLAARPAGRR